MKSQRGAPARRGHVFLYGFLPVLLAAVFALYRPWFLPRLDDTVYDSVMRAGTPPLRGPRVVIVDIDERSLSSIGQWPWRRDVVGTLITRLREKGPSV